MFRDVSEASLFLAISLFSFDEAFMARPAAGEKVMNLLAKVGIDYEKWTNFRCCSDALRTSSLDRQISRRTDGSASDPTVGSNRSSASAQGLFCWILPNRPNRPNRGFPSTNS
jgi:hypothetical protein